MSSSFYLPKFQQFKHFDSTINNYEDRPYNLMSHVERIKEQIVGPTEDCQKVTDNEKYKTRSVKIVVDSLGISFEENFMDEHKFSFTNQLQKYMEHQQTLFPSLLTEGLSLKIISNPQNYSDNFSLTKVIRDNSSLMSEYQTQMLLIDLKREDKLNEFLEYTLRKVHEDLRRELIFLANQLWEQYTLIQDMNYTFQETIEFAQAFSSKILERVDQKLSLLNFRYALKLNKSTAESSEIKQRLTLFRKFLTFWNTTLSLLIGGYFQNPYNSREQNYYKRELNELGLCFENDDEFHDRDIESQQSQEQQGIIKSKRVKH